MPPQDPGSFGCLQPAGGAASIPALPGAGGGRVRRRLLACESCCGSCGVSGVCRVSVLSPIYLSLCHLPSRGGRRLPRCRGFLSLSVYSASRAGACATPLGLCRGCSDPPGGVWGSSGVPPWDARRPRDGSQQPGPTLLRGLGGGAVGSLLPSCPPPPNPRARFCSGGALRGTPASLLGCGRVRKAGPGGCPLRGVLWGAPRCPGRSREPVGACPEQPLPLPGQKGGRAVGSVACGAISRRQAGSPPFKRLN